MDIYDNTILCKRCSKQMDKIVITKEGYNLRAWRCPECKIMQLHPLDSEKYTEFQRLKQRDFEVKLRMIGNSFCVSIPREIIEFEKEMQKKMDNLIRMSLENPGTLTLHFNRKIKKIGDTFEKE